MAEKKLSNTEVLSLLSKFETEWSQFRGMWDQLTPSFQYMSAVVARCEEISHAMPQMEMQYRNLGVDLESRQKLVATGKKEIADQLKQYRDQMERELAPLIKELHDTREKVIAIQGARADAERSFQERKHALETDVREMDDRLAETQRKLDEIGRMTEAVRAR